MEGTEYFRKPQPQPQRAPSDVNTQWFECEADMGTQMPTKAWQCTQEEPTVGAVMKTQTGSPGAVRTPLQQSICLIGMGTLAARSHSRDIGISF